MFAVIIHNVVTTIVVIGSEGHFSQISVIMVFSRHFPKHVSLSDTPRNIAGKENGRAKCLRKSVHIPM